ncbi:hypothetical protein OG455_37130 [Kitasatospora sp. NBC_01287]|uniref:hypothetical protein n=1 Tax=Kitasatospora sp. NBC_01287 TaxID=2903573 RepID=UPI002250BE66|nr:hypothetical protein [Kitasatospora sp. NBC_01287]MCX4751064.1 hypothetical protein [Kitasatospora sp. NBC_01287]
MAILDVLTEVARTGRLGPVFIGADLSEVTAVAGEPWDAGSMSRRRQWPRLFGYGDLELSVCRCRRVNLVCIQTWRDVVELPPSLAGGSGTFPAAIGFADVVSALEQAGCPWQPHPSLTFGDQCSLVATPSATTFTFEILQGSGPVLNVVGLPGDGHDCPTGR